MKTEILGGREMVGRLPGPGEGGVRNFTKQSRLWLRREDKQRVVERVFGLYETKPYVRDYSPK